MRSGVGAIWEGRRCAAVRFFLDGFFLLLLETWLVEEVDWGVSAGLYLALRSDACGRLSRVSNGACLDVREPSLE